LFGDAEIAGEEEERESGMLSTEPAGQSVAEDAIGKVEVKNCKVEVACEDGGETLVRGGFDDDFAAEMTEKQGTNLGVDGFVIDTENEGTILHTLGFQAALGPNSSRCDFGQR